MFYGSQCTSLSFSFSRCDSPQSNRMGLKGQNRNWNNRSEILCAILYLKSGIGGRSRVNWLFEIYSSLRWSDWWLVLIRLMTGMAEFIGGNRRIANALTSTLVHTSRKFPLALGLNPMNVRQVICKTWNSLDPTLIWGTDILQSYWIPRLSTCVSTVQFQFRELGGAQFFSGFRH